MSEETEFSIPGVDVQHGIAMTGGRISGYSRVLSMFCKDGEARLQKFRFFMFESMNSGNDTLPEKYLSMFTTQVHAIKSAAATIGAADVSVEAAALEAAGKASNLDFIRDKMGDFADHLEELITNIKTKTEQAPEQTQEMDISEYIYLCRELVEALKSQNLGEIDRLMEELSKKPMDPKTREMVELISDEVLMAEFGRAIETIEELISKKD